MARNEIAKKTLDVAAMTLSFQFAGVESPVVVNVADFPPEIKDRLVLHGAIQKLGDSYAGAKTVPDAQAEFGKVLENLQNGVWGRERGAGEEEGSLLGEAVARLKSISRIDAEKLIEEREAKMAGFTKALRGKPEIIALMGQIKSERAAKRAGEGPSLESLLA